MATGKQVAQARQRAKLGGEAPPTEPKRGAGSLAVQIATARQEAALASQAERQRKALELAKLGKPAKPGKGG